VSRAPTILSHENSLAWSLQLRETDPHEAQQRSADLREADLQGADLRRAHLHSADPTRANLDNGAKTLLCDAYEQLRYIN